MSTIEKNENRFKQNYFIPGELEESDPYKNHAVKSE
jgi:hypothetical protein